MSKELRSSKWAFLFYKESVPNDYLTILNNLHIPYIISPWHDKDINADTGELKKAHKHGCFYFDSLKSYSQVVEILKPLHGPSHVEIVHSPKGMFDYFIHADNPTKASYDVDDIEFGCGFNLDNFLQEQNPPTISQVLDIIEQNSLFEFQKLVRHAKEEEPKFLPLIVKWTYFFSKYIDSKRYAHRKE